MALKFLHVSEKATGLSHQNKYVFRVETRATKPQVKKEIEKIYGVKVGRVNIISMPGKKKRLGRTEGFRPGFKKAVVTLKEGKIEIS